MCICSGYNTGISWQAKVVTMLIASTWCLFEARRLLSIQSNLPLVHK